MDNKIDPGLIPAHLLREPESNIPQAKQSMGKDDFMKLLMAQLQNQDPLKPMDHEQFSAQLAQFSSLEQLTNIGKGIDTLHTGFGEESKMQALGMIGKRIQASGNEVELMTGTSVTLGNNLPEGTRPTKATIIDPSGKIVRELTISEKNAGQIVWDGKDQDGTSLPSGKYAFRVFGVDSAGQAKSGGAEVSGVVTGVELQGKNAILVVESPNGSKTKIEMTKVSSVSLDKESAPIQSHINAENQLKAKAPVSKPNPEAEAEAEIEPDRERESANELKESEPETSEMGRPNSEEALAFLEEHGFVPGAQAQTILPTELLKP